MIPKSGFHFCDKIMLKNVIRRGFLSARRFHLDGARATQRLLATG
jgi:hypothetical protein